MKIGIYKHFRGKLYNVLGLTLNTETKEKLVLYKCLYEVSGLGIEYGKDPFFVRPYSNFIEEIKIDGKTINRFTYIGENKYEDI